jgi:hypothetical protein
MEYDKNNMCTGYVSSAQAPNFATATSTVRLPQPDRPIIGWQALSAVQISSGAPACSRTEPRLLRAYGQRWNKMSRLPTPPGPTFLTRTPVPP